MSQPNGVATHQIATVGTAMREGADQASHVFRGRRATIAVENDDESAHTDRPHTRIVRLTHPQWEVIESAN